MSLGVKMSPSTDEYDGRYGQPYLGSWCQCRCEHSGGHAWPSQGVEMSSLVAMAVSQALWTWALNFTSNCGVMKRHDKSWRGWKIQVSHSGGVVAFPRRPGQKQLD